MPNQSLKNCLTVSVTIVKCDDDSIKMRFLTHPTRRSSNLIQNNLNNVQMRHECDHETLTRIINNRISNDKQTADQDHTDHMQIFIDHVYGMLTRESVAHGDSFKPRS